MALPLPRYTELINRLGAPQTFDGGITITGIKMRLRRSVIGTDTTLSLQMEVDGSWYTVASAVNPLPEDD